MWATISILLAFVIVRLVNVAFTISTRKSVLVEDDEHLVAATKSGDPLVVVCGPAGSGKTRLFHALLNPNIHPTKIHTVKSLIHLEARLQSIRLVDCSSHLDSTKLLTAAQRIVLVVDSTRPVKDAATILWSLKCTPFSLLVVCTKADLPRAKNPSRLKLQLKQEMERIRKTCDSSELIVDLTEVQFLTNENLDLLREWITTGVKHCE